MQRALGEQQRGNCFFQKESVYAVLRVEGKRGENSNGINFRFGQTGYLSMLRNTSIPRITKWTIYMTPNLDVQPPL